MDADLFREMLALLRDLEWCDPDGDPRYRYCPACGNYSPDLPEGGGGHADDCRLVDLIRRGHEAADGVPRSATLHVEDLDYCLLAKVVGFDGRLLWSEHFGNFDDQIPRAVARRWAAENHYRLVEA